MTTYYKTDGFLKTSEVDDFENGCLPETMQDYEIDVEFKDASLSALIDKVKAWLQVEDSESVLLNSCDEMGRIDIQLLEDGYGYPPTSIDIKNWKAGKLKLWAATYSTHVYKIVEESVDLDVLKV